MSELRDKNKHLNKRDVWPSHYRIDPTRKSNVLGTVCHFNHQQVFKWNSKWNTRKALKRAQTKKEADRIKVTGDGTAVSLHAEL